jgi:hypothetical protein
VAGLGLRERTLRMVGIAVPCARAATGMRARLFVSARTCYGRHTEIGHAFEAHFQGGRDGFGLKLLHEVIPKFVQRNLVRMQYISGYPADC